VIEDTESSLDLVSRGWRIFNYLERLAYSATPPDFGSLIVQRRRWANGGLLILPKLLRNLPVRKGIRRVPETMLRVYYLTATPVINLAMLTMLACPFERHLEGSWPFLYMAALPYYLLFLRDLIATGYTWNDLLRVYSLSLLLIAVNLGGVAKSLQQWWTGKATPFARTPKVPGRTAAQPIYIVMPAAIAICTLALGIDDLFNRAWFLAGFALINAVSFGYAFFRFIGVGEAFEDLGVTFAGSSRIEEAGVIGMPPASEETSAIAGASTARLAEQLD
jgi:cellulose synthase (UDP-forming)